MPWQDDDQEEVVEQRGGRGGQRRGQGELEGMVLTALGQAPGPVTAEWVRARLGVDIAYTTVLTILTRLLEKGAVVRERRGRSFAWTAVADGAGLAAGRMRRVLEAEGDRGAVLASFVSSLSSRDERLLRSLLAETEEDER